MFFKLNSLLHLQKLNPQIQTPASASQDMWGHFQLTL